MMGLRGWSKGLDGYCYCDGKEEVEGELMKGTSPLRVWD